MSLEKLWESIASYNNPQLATVLVIVAVICLMWAVRHLSASGTDKLAAEKAERSEAIEVLERQIERADKKTLEQDRRIKALEEDRLRDARYEQDYRHALSNMVQEFMAWGSIMHEILMVMCKEWDEMPEELRARINSLPHATEIRERHPVPHREPPAHEH